MTETAEAQSTDAQTVERQAEEVALARLPAPANEIAVVLGLPPDAVHVNGLSLTNPDTTFEEWQGYAYAIGFVGRWHRFALGDWLLFGEAIFGEDSAQAVEGTAADRYDVAHRITGLQVATLQNYASLCSRIPLTIRRVELDFSTHEPVAALERADQIYWLAQAVEQGYDRAELRQAIKDARTPAAEDDDAEEPGPEVVPPKTRSEQLEEVLSAVWHSGQPTSEGGALIPPEAWSRVAAAVGEE